MLKSVAAVLAGSGVALVALTHDNDQPSPPGAGDLHYAYLIGCFFLMLQGVGIAVFCLAQKSLVRGSQSVPFGPITVTAHAYLIAGPVLLGAGVLATLSGVSHPLSKDAWDRLLDGPAPLAAIAYAVILASVVGYTLRAKANKVLDAGTLVLYNTVQPPLTAMLAFMVGTSNEQMSLTQWIGTGLVGLAVIIASRDAAEHARKSPLSSETNQTSERVTRLGSMDDAPLLPARLSSALIDESEGVVA